MTRAEFRRMANTFAKCKFCGDRMLLKNMEAHMHKAMLHNQTRKRKAKNAG